MPISPDTKPVFQAIDTPAFEYDEAKHYLGKYRGLQEKMASEEFTWSDLADAFKTEAHLTSYTALACYQQEKDSFSSDQIQEQGYQWMEASKIAQKVQSEGIESLEAKDLSILAGSIGAFYVANFLPDLIDEHEVGMNNGLVNLARQLEPRANEIEAGYNLPNLVRIPQFIPEELKLKNDFLGEWGKDQRELSDAEIKQLLLSVAENPALYLLAKAQGGIRVLTGESNKGWKGGWERSLRLLDKNKFLEGIGVTGFHSGSRSASWTDHASQPEEFIRSNDGFIAADGCDLFSDRVLHLDKGIYYPFRRKDMCSDDLTKQVTRYH